jgi:ParB family chromosome partitioning protein
MSEPVSVREPSSDSPDSGVQSTESPVAEIEAKPTPQVSGTDEQEEPGIVRIRLDDIIPNTYQPRSTINEQDLEGLAASIRETGLMQPIAVRALPMDKQGNDDPRFELIAGERRWRAARLAGLDRIPAIVHNVDDRRSAEWAIIENVQREDLNPIDRGQAYANLAKRFGLTQADIAERVGVNRSTVANLIRVLELEPEIRDLISTGALSTGHAKALLSMPAGTDRVRVAREAIDRSQTVRALEAICSSHAERGVVAPKPKPVDKREPEIVAAIEDLAKGIGEHLGTRVRLRTKDGKKGTLEIDFYDLDHFDGLMQRIGYHSGA